MLIRLVVDMLKHRRSRKDRDCLKQSFSDKQGWGNAKNYTPLPLTYSFLSTDTEIGQIVAGTKFYKMTTNGFSTFYVVNPMDSKIKSENIVNIEKTFDVEKWSKTSRSAKNKRKPLQLWTTDDVSSWLQYLSLSLRERYETQIIRHEITGRALARFNDSNLKLIGVQNASDRSTILQNILLLKMRQDLHVIKRSYLH